MAKKPTASSWSGDLDVEPIDDFTINVRHMTFKEKHISVVWKGRDRECGDFEFRVLAARQSNGYYQSKAIPYKTGDTDCEATIYFLVVKVAKGKLHVEGFWAETDVCSWKFYGWLDPLNPKPN